MVPTTWSTLASPSRSITDDELDKLLDGFLSKDTLHDSFHSPPEYHPNTRVTVLNEIGEWIDESGSEKLPLLAVGKSVMAKTISSGFHDQIVAPFIFSPSSGRSAATLLPTLAWQLVLRIPDTREHIIATLKKHGLLQTNQIEAQFDLLIVQLLKGPIRSWSLRGSMNIQTKAC